MPGRYQDILELRASGISVMTTVNIQHLASLQDTVRLVAGVTVSENVARLGAGLRGRAGDR